MALLELQILSEIFAILSLALPLIRATAFGAANLQSILPGTVFVKFTFRLPLRTHGAAFLLHALDGTMAFFVSVVLPFHGVYSTTSGAKKQQREEHGLGVSPDRAIFQKYVLSPID